MMSDGNTPSAGTPAPVSAPASPSPAPAPSGTPDPVSSADSSPTPETPAGRRYKVNIDGQDSEVDEAELVKGYQLEKASRKRMEEAATYRKQVEQLMTALYQGKGASVLQKLPPEARKALVRDLIAQDDDVRMEAENHFINAIKYEKMTPEQRRAHDLEQENRRYKDRDAEIQTRREAAQREQEAQQHQAYLEQAFPKALEANGLKTNRYAVARMARYLELGLPRGTKITEQHLHAAAGLVKQDYDAEYKEMLSQMDPESFVKQYGEDFVAKLRQWDIARVAPKTPSAPVARANNGQFVKKEESRAGSLEDFARELERKRGF